MDELSVAKIIGLAIKIFALMTPTGVLSYFINNTSGIDKRTRSFMAAKTALAIFIIGVCLFLFGPALFDIFGFTVNAFRIGVGVLLFLAAVRLMNDEELSLPPPKDKDISVVPLAIPLGMGPSTIGWVIVLGSDIKGTADIVIAIACIFIAALSMGLLLLLADPVRKILGKTGIAIMGKLTALILSAVAAQVIFTGIRGFLFQQ